MIPFLKSRKKIQVYWLRVKMYIFISFLLFVGNYARIKGFSSREGPGSADRKKTL